MKTKIFICCIIFAFFVGCKASDDEKMDEKSSTVEFNSDVEGIYNGLTQNGDPNLPEGLLLVDNNGNYCFGSYSGWDDNIYLGKFTQITEAPPFEFTSTPTSYDGRTGQKKETYSLTGNYVDDVLEFLSVGAGHYANTDMKFVGTRNTQELTSLIGNWAHGGDIFEVNSAGEIIGSFESEYTFYCSVTGRFEIDEKLIRLQLTFSDCNNSGMNGQYNGLFGFPLPNFDQYGVGIVHNSTLDLAAYLKFSKQ